MYDCCQDARWRAFVTWLGQQLFILFTNTTLNRLGFEILTVGPAIFHWLYFEYICWHKCIQNIANEIWLFPRLVSLYQAKVKIESMEEYADAKIKSKPQLGNSDVIADYFYSSAEIKKK